MAIFRRDKYRRYGSQRLEYRRFGTPVKGNDKEQDAEGAFLSRRLFLFKGVAATSFAAMAGRIGYLQVVPHAKTNATDVEQQVIRKQVVKAPRGLIVDRNGETLAENRKVFGLALIRANLPPARSARREAMFAEIEKYVPLPWAITIVPLGARATAALQVSDYAKRLEKPSDFSENQLINLLSRANPDPILLAKDYTKADIAQLRASLADIKGIEFLRYAEYLVSPAAQPDAERPTLVYRGLDKQVALALDANANDFPGMIVDESVLARHYPAGALTAHVLGYIGPVLEDELAKDPVTGETTYQKDDLIGRTGIEAALEDELRGRSGTRYYLVDSQEADRGTVRQIDAQPGGRLELTLDSGLQKVARDALLAQMARAQEHARETDATYEVHSAVAVALDPRNGEVLAMVSLPSFDPQVFVDGRDVKLIKTLFEDETKSPMLNKAINGLFPPGSTLKPFLAAGGLQEGTLNLTKTYDCYGYIYLPESLDETARNQKPCWVVKSHIAPHGTQNVVDAIANSCDIFFYCAGAPRQIDETTGKPSHYYLDVPNRGQVRRDFDGLGIANLDKYLLDFGFGGPTGIRDLPNESKGVVPNEEYKLSITKSKQQPNGDPWALGDTINVTIGQGYFLCTPMQMATATAAIATNGAVPHPHLVRRVLDNDGRVRRTADSAPLRKLVVQPEHLEVVRQGMRKVITDGTASPASSTVRFTVPVEFAGKTGTAEFGPYIDATVKGRPLTYQHQHAWFTAFAPYKDPEIAVVVCIIGGGEGVSFAAPAANDILTAYFNRKGK